MLIVALAYAVALGVGGGALFLLPDWPEIWRVLVADGLATTVVFCFSRGHNNSSLYDPYWSLIPPAVVIYLIFRPGRAASLERSLLLALPVLLWGTRLTINWLRSWAGLHTEDWRYLSFKPRTGRWYWPMSFGSFHLFPTLMVFAGIIPLFPSLLNWPAAAYHPLNGLDVLAAGVALGGAMVEAIADEQLWQFRQRSDRQRGEVLQTGLWRYSRHPNYFGELSFWLGLGLFGLAANPAAYWWSLGGFAAMLALFVGYSIPAMEAKLAHGRPAYRQYRRRTSALVPWPPRNEAA